MTFLLEQNIKISKRAKKLCDILELDIHLKLVLLVRNSCVFASIMEDIRFWSRSLNRHFKDAVTKDAHWHGIFCSAVSVLVEVRFFVEEL